MKLILFDEPPNYCPECGQKVENTSTELTEAPNNLSMVYPISEGTTQEGEEVSLIPVEVYSAEPCGHKLFYDDFAYP